MLSLNFRRLFVAGVAAGFLSMGLALLQQSTSLAADYPGDFCKFSMASDESHILASCAEKDKSKGTLDTARFSKVSSGSKYSFTDSFWKKSDGSPRAPSTEYTHEKPSGSGWDEVKCSAAVIQIKKAASKEVATISGQYAYGPGGTGTSITGPRIECTALTPGVVTVSKSVVRLEAWRDTLHQQVTNNLPDKACAKSVPREKAACTRGIVSIIDSCIGSSGSVWKTTPSYVDDDEQKKAYREYATNCLSSKITTLSKADIRKIVNNAGDAADKEESKHADTEAPPEGDPDDKTSCAIDGIGWLVCPTLKFIGWINDSAFTFLSSMLEVEPILLSDPDTKTAWEQFRNIANVAFAIAFLIIIYSQITGAGVTNYGIKRMLPRLIVAAILVNISYYLCQIAVDLSNIIGSSIYGFFKDIPTTAGGTADASDLKSWEAALAGALAVTAAVGIAVLVASVLGGAALLAFALVILILVARKAILVLLIVISPLAFVAYLLPNTEQWFKKWWKLFSALLVLFPVIGIIFGASFLAARIISNAGGGTADDDWVLQLTALGIMAIPLFAVPSALKGAMAATGAIGAKLGAWQDKAMGAAGKTGKDRIKRKTENWEAKAAGYQGTGGRFVRFAGGYRNRRAFGRTSMEKDTARRQQQALTGHVLENKYKYNPRQVAEAQSAALKEYHEEVGREKSTMSDLEHKDLLSIVNDRSASEERRAAAAGVIGSRSYRKGHQELLDAIGAEDHPEKGTETLKTIQQQVASDMKDMPKGMGDSDKSALGEGRFHKKTGKNAAGVKRTVSEESMLERLHQGKISSQAFATLNPDDLTLIAKLKTDGHLTPEAQASIDSLINDLNRPENATIYAAAKDNARAIHKTLHS